MLKKVKIPGFIWTILTMLLFFLITVLIRYGYMSYKVPSNNQGHLILLTTLENFVKQGATDCYYSPIQTWNNKGDKHITYYKRLEDYKGNNYYISHPPFSFILTYSVFKILNLTPNQFALQLMGLISHLLSAVFIYLIITNYFNRRAFAFFFPAIISYISYLFVPVLMHLYLYHIFCETFVQPFWIIGIYFTLILFKNEVNRKKLFLLGILIFLMIYTEWLGLFFAFALSILCLYYRKREKKYKLIFLTSLISSVLALFTILIQYSSINGFSSFIHSFYIRFIERSGFFGNGLSDQGLSFLNPQSYLLLLKQIHNLMNGFGYLFLAMFIVSLIITIRSKNYKFKLSQEAKYLITLSLLPPLMYFFVFFNASIIHYIYIAKFAVPMSLFMGVIYKKLLLAFSFKQTKFFIFTFAIVKVAVLIISIYIFIARAPYDENYAYLEKVTEIITDNTTGDEAIFVNIKSKAFNPLVFLNYSTKRNIMFSNNQYQAKKLMIDNNKQKAVFFRFNQKKNFYSIEHLKNDSVK
ncbi:MAG: hypothetical protein KA792_08960 [Bacteroidales bacterium]|nr:hypothetical protein [Bacteroidales bacterium]